MSRFVDRPRLPVHVLRTDRMGRLGSTRTALGWFGSLRLRYFGPRPLIQDNSARSKATTLVNGRVGYAFENGISMQVEALNLFDVKASQIDYFYESRLPGEPAAGGRISTFIGWSRWRCGLRWWSGFDASVQTWTDDCEDLDKSLIRLDKMSSAEHFLSTPLRENRVVADG